jgi:hypothetical protein
MYENRFLCEKNLGRTGILLAYNRRIHHPNDNDKNVHPLNSPKLRMAKVRDDEKLKKQILDQTLLCGKEKGYSAKLVD